MFEAIVVGLLANPQTRARYDASVQAHAVRGAKHPYSGKAHPTFGEWVKNEALDIAEAFRAPAKEMTDHG